MSIIEKISQDVKEAVVNGIKSRLRLVCGVHHYQMTSRVAYQSYIEGLHDAGYLFDWEYITLLDFGVSHTGEISLEEKESYIDKLFNKRLE